MGPPKRLGRSPRHAKRAVPPVFRPVWTATPRAPREALPKPVTHQRGPQSSGKGRLSTSGRFHGCLATRARASSVQSGLHPDIRAGFGTTAGFRVLMVRARSDLAHRLRDSADAPSTALALLRHDDTADAGKTVSRDRATPEKARPEPVVVTAECSPCGVRKQPHGVARAFDEIIGFPAGQRPERRFPARSGGTGSNRVKEVMRAGRRPVSAADAPPADRAEACAPATRRGGGGGGSLPRRAGVRPRAGRHRKTDGVAGDPDATGALPARPAGACRAAAPLR